MRAKEHMMQEISVGIANSLTLKGTKTRFATVDVSQDSDVHVEQARLLLVLHLWSQYAKLRRTQ